VLILGFSGDDIWQHILGNTQLLLWWLFLPKLESFNKNNFLA
jgi:hypothetical protein